MMGNDWEDFFKKYFDQTWGGDLNGVDGNKNGHLGGSGAGDGRQGRDSNASGATNNNSNGAADDGVGAQWEEWAKGMIFNFMTTMVGQEATNRFQQSSFHARPPTASAGDGGRR